MKLPEPFLAEFLRRRGGARSRAGYACDVCLQGELGETYLAADAEGLLLFSRSVAGLDEHRSFAWTNIRHLGVRPQRVFTALQLHTAGERFTLQFSGWEAASLRDLLELWNARRGTASPPAGNLEPTPATAANAAVRLTAPPPRPLTLFCAALHAMIECDERVEPAELKFLTRRLRDETFLCAGRECLRTHGVEAVCQALQEALDEPQRDCTLVNLIAVARVDGCLGARERELLGRFQVALGLSASRRQELFDVLLIKNNLALLADTSHLSATQGDELTPILTYCAALWAMITADQTTLPEEQELLTLTVPYPEDICLGRECVQAQGVDFLLSRLPQVLALAQRLCAPMRG